jgi:lipoyl(octanoyl) transferase
MPLPMQAPVEWLSSPGLTDYTEALAIMATRTAAIANGAASELIWLVEHPPLYTAGTNAQPGDLIDPRFPVFTTGRGGRYTYHGPGQRVVYVMLDLNRRNRDIRCFIHGMEQWIIQSLSLLGINGRREAGRVGIWSDDPEYGEAKIAAIGVRVTRWVTMHGFAINLDPNLSHFSGIIPCGILEHGVTSVANLGGNATHLACDNALKATFLTFLATLQSKQSA